MFSKSAKILLYLKAHALDFYIRGDDNVGKIDFPSVVINHLEIVDHTKLNELIISFIARSELGDQDATLLLSDEVIFHKKIGRDSPEVEEELIESFFDKVPLDKSHQAKKVIVQDDFLYPVATNKNLYEAIVKSFVNNGWKINAVVPAIVFGDLSSSLDPELVDNILKADDLIQKYDLLHGDNNSAKYDTSESDSKPSDSTPQTPKKGAFVWILLLILLVLLSSGGYAAYKFGYLKRALNKLNPPQNKTETQTQDNPKEKLDASTAPSSTSSAQQQSTASAQLKKDQLKLQVLNGSGIAGQAAKVKEELLKLNYVSVTTGNNPESTSTSQIQFSKTLKADDKNQILEDIKKVIGNVNELAESISDFDINLILGQDISN